MKFKEIDAMFKAEGRDACKGKVFEIRVQRIKSGAFAYGDQSATVITFDGNEDSKQVYDTRYMNISTTKVGWVEFWKNYLLSNYLIKNCEIVSYQENEIEVED